MNFEDIDILDLLPHRPPFLMVDHLTKYSSSSVETTFLVKENCILAKGGRLSACGVIENMAQSSAARIGYYYKYILHQPVQIGYIGAVNDFKLYRCPEVGEMLTTRIEVQVEWCNITAFKATVFDKDNEIVAVADMKTAL